MIRPILAAAIAALVLIASPVPPARAGGWQYDPASDVIYFGLVPVGQWYGERPSMRPPTFRAPAHVRPCPHRTCGYPLPIYRAPTAVEVEVPRAAGRSSHAEWCAARYRSYDRRSDTWQPYRGPRRACRSPWR